MLERIMQFNSSELLMFLFTIGIAIVGLAILWKDSFGCVAAALVGMALMSLLLVLIGIENTLGLLAFFAFIAFSLASHLLLSSDKPVRRSAVAHHVTYNRRRYGPDQYGIESRNRDTFYGSRIAPQFA